MEDAKEEIDDLNSFGAFLNVSSRIFNNLRTIVLTQSGRYCVPALALIFMRFGIIPMTMCVWGYLFLLDVFRVIPWSQKESKGKNVNSQIYCNINCHSYFSLIETFTSNG